MHCLRKKGFFFFCSQKILPCLSPFNVPFCTGRIVFLNGQIQTRRECNLSYPYSSGKKRSYPVMSKNNFEKHHSDKMLPFGGIFNGL